jgi:hypothetical protein
LKKILNLYCGIGGNRKFWPKAINGQEVQITAVELNPKIAAIYKELYPDDEVIIADAHEYLLQHYQEFDFIWASPPCQSHSRIRYYFGFRGKPKNVSPLFPDMKLWQEIVFLNYYAKCDWVVENVIPYYSPMIAPTFQLQRHFFWSNKVIDKANFAPDKIRGGTIREYQNRLGIDLSKYSGINKTQILHNCVAPEVGKYIFDNFFN